MRPYKLVKVRQSGVAEWHSANSIFSRVEFRQVNLELHQGQMGRRAKACEGTKV